MKSWFFATSTTLVVCGVVGLAAYADHDEDDRVEELMERTHEGRRSPYAQLRQIVEGPGAAWPVIEQVVLGFEPMRRALVESKNDDIKGSADGYVDAVDAIAAAVKRRDAAGVRSGFDSLKQSCADCHYDGGIGGELDD